MWAGVLDATLAPHARWLIDIGGDVQWTSGRHLVRRSLNDAPVLAPIGDYDASERGGIRLRLDVIHCPATSFRSRRACASIAGRQPMPQPRRRGSAPGCASPPRPRFARAAGPYQQFADLEQILGVRGGGATLQPERARHVDVMVTQSLPLSTSLQASWFARDEGDVLWTPGRSRGGWRTDRFTRDAATRRGSMRWMDAPAASRSCCVAMRRAACPAGPVMPTTVTATPRS